MSWDSKNVYYNPEDFCLTIVAEIGDDDANYSFDSIVVWKHDETGKLYWARDSGCSCPSPFEDFNSIDELNPLISVQEMREYLKEERYVTRNEESRANFLRAIKEAF